jgi:hypothetical protein
MSDLAAAGACPLLAKPINDLGSAVETQQVDRLPAQKSVIITAGALGDGTEMVEESRSLLSAE